MPRTTSTDLPLLPEWAFVVQFREGTAPLHDRIEGRVEHVLSGEAVRFSSLAELEAFLTRMLATVHVRPPTR